jgi:uncharacterized OB-fold protein
MRHYPLIEPPSFPFAQPFWDAVQREQLALPRCSVCRAWQWYPQPAGTCCADGELAWSDVATTGTIYSFSRVHRSFLPGVRPETPYVVGFIDLDGVDGPRLVANLADSPHLAIGARVTASFPRTDGCAHPEFRLDREEGQLA